MRKIDTLSRELVPLLKAFVTVLKRGPSFLFFFSACQAVGDEGHGVNRVTRDIDGASVEPGSR